MSIKIEKAMHFAKLAHEGQVRDCGEPYFNHVYRVFERLLILLDSHKLIGCEPFGKEDILCAALLHDVIEDTDVDFSNINMNFGYDVATLVKLLTNEDDKSLNRKARINNREKKYAIMPNAAKIIKLADRIDNILSINSKGGDFKDKYLYETCGLMWAIYDEDKNKCIIIDKLWAKLQQVCQDSYRSDLDVFDIKASIECLLFRDICIKWEEENQDKIEQYDR